MRFCIVLLWLWPTVLRAQQPALLPAGLTHPDSLRAWQPGRPTADTARLKQLIRHSRRLIITDFDSARLLAQQAVALAWRRHQGIGLVYGLSMLASSYYYVNDLLAAQRTYEQLLWAARRTKRLELVGPAYMGLGLVARELENQAGAEQYFVRAQRAYATSQPRDRDGELAVLANRAYNYLDTDSVKRAQPLVRQLLALLRQFPQVRHPAKYQVIVGLTQLKAGQPDSAEATYERAARLGRATQDPNPEAEALLALAEMALRRSNYPLALRHARRATRLFRDLGDPQEADALKQQAAALAGLRRPEAYDTLRHYLTLYDSLLARQRTEAVAIAQARFDQTEQQARIRALEQQRRIERLEAEQRRTRTRLQLGGLAGASVLLGLLGLGTYRRRQRQREEALRHQLAADLHDDVGSLLARIALQTDLLQEGLTPPAQLQAQWAEVAGNSRLAVRQLNDVVWNLDAQNDSVPNLLDRLRDYAHEVLVPTGRDVRFVTDAAAGAVSDLPPAVRRQVYLIYKEAVHNILKYAPDDALVTVRLHRDKAALVLEIVNSGPPPAAGNGRDSGHGLRNMHTRATALGGTARTGPEPGGGFAVRVHVPV